MNSHRRMSRGAFEGYLVWVRGAVNATIEGYLREDDPRTGFLYKLLTDYPLRPAKCLRPALCMAVVGDALGSERSALPTATALELYHNAFLIHDDIEDGAELRRGGPALHREQGVSIALNVGDMLLAMALRPLLANTEHLDLGRALRVMSLVSEMAVTTAEGQAIELSWIRESRWAIADEDYEDMVARKTAAYSFVTPVRAGCVVGRVEADVERKLAAWAHALGVAFQIHDDILNLVQSHEKTGKERWADLREGKRTLMLAHFFREAPDAEARRARALLAALAVPDAAPPPWVAARVEALVTAGRLSRDEARSLLVNAAPEGAGSELFFLLESRGSLAYAQARAAAWSERASDLLRALDGAIGNGEHGRFLRSVHAYVIDREW